MDESFPYRKFPKPIDSYDVEYKKIILRFPKEMSYRVYDEFDVTQIKRQKNGDLIVSAKIPENTWIIGFLLSFGTQVEILSPIYLKEVIAEQAKLIYEKNKS